MSPSRPPSQISGFSGADTASEESVMSDFDEIVFADEIDPEIIAECQEKRPWLRHLITWLLLAVFIIGFVVGVVFFWMALSDAQVPVWLSRLLNPDPPV